MDVTSTIARLRDGFARAGATPAVRILAARALAHLRRRGAGGARLAALLAALPLPALGLGAVLCCAALVFAPVQAAQVLQLLALLPEGLWWALATCVGAVFGLRLQAREQDFARDMAQPASDLSAADPGPDAALALESLTVGDNPALADWLATGDAAASGGLSFRET